MAKIANKQVICDVLVEEGKKDKDIVVPVSYTHLDVYKRQNPN